MVWLVPILIPLLIRTLVVIGSRLVLTGIVAFQGRQVDMALDQKRRSIEMLVHEWKQLHASSRRILVARAFRSLRQGIFVIDFALYLHALLMSGFMIGLVLSAAGFFGAIFNLIVGITSDRLRRKPFLLWYEPLLLIYSLAALLTSNIPVLAGFGEEPMGPPDNHKVVG